MNFGTYPILYNYTFQLIMYCFYSTIVFPFSLAFVLLFSAFLLLLHIYVYILTNDSKTFDFWDLNFPFRLKQTHSFLEVRVSFPFQISCKYINLLFFVSIFSASKTKTFLVKELLQNQQY